MKSLGDGLSLLDTRRFSPTRLAAMYFIEQSYANDQTNWWIPNRAAAEAMLRSSGLEILDASGERRPGSARPRARCREGRSVHPRLELTGTL